MDRAGGGDALIPWSRGAMLRGALLALLLAGCSGGGGRAATAAQSPWDGEVQVHGSLRAMMHEGQTGAQVTLDTLLPDSTLYAVGAQADLSGEVTVLGGAAYLDYPVGRDSARTENPGASDAGACLLVAARVGSWRAVTMRACSRTWARRRTSTECSSSRSPPGTSTA